MCWFVTAASCGALTVADSDESDGLTSGVTTDTVLVTCATGYESSAGGATFTASCDGFLAGTSTWTGVETCDGILSHTHHTLARMEVSVVYF